MFSPNSVRVLDTVSLSTDVATDLNVSSLFSVITCSVFFPHREKLRQMIVCLCVQHRALKYKLSHLSKPEYLNRREMPQNALYHGIPNKMGNMYLVSRTLNLERAIQCKWLLKMALEGSECLARLNFIGLFHPQLLEGILCMSAICGKLGQCPVLTVF